MQRVMKKIHRQETENWEISYFDSLISSNKFLNPVLDPHTNREPRPSYSGANQSLNLTHGEGKPVHADEHPLFFHNGTGDGNEGRGLWSIK